MQYISSNSVSDNNSKNGSLAMFCCISSFRDFLDDDTRVCMLYECMNAIIGSRTHSYCPDFLIDPFSS